MAEEEYPGQVSLDQIRRDMNSNANMQPVRNRWDADGTYVITYSFNPQMETDYSEVTHIRRLNRAQRQSLLHAMREYEAGAGWRFEKAKGSQPPDARFAQGHTDAWNGNTRHLSGNRTEVLITDRFSPEDYRFGRFGHAVIAHELGHAGGLRHIGSTADSPPNDGWSESSNSDISSQSYWPGELKVRSVGPADVMTLQQANMYGPPKHNTPRGVPRRIDPTDISFLYNSEPLTLVIDPGENSRGYMNVNLRTENFAHQMEGIVWKEGDKEDWPVGVRFVPGTHIEDVRMVADTQVALRAKGSNRSRLKGGGGDDDLYAGEGGNVLTGGEGRDNFIFDDGSGKRNVVTDFTAAEDRLIARSGIDRVELQECASFINGTYCEGTTAAFLKDLDVVAEAFIQNARAEKVERNIVSAEGDRNFSVDIIPPELPSPSVPRQPVGVPLVFRGKGY